MGEDRQAVTGGVPRQVEQDICRTIADPCVKRGIGATRHLMPLVAQSAQFASNRVSRGIVREGDDAKVLPVEMTPHRPQEMGDRMIPQIAGDKTETHGPGGIERDPPAPRRKPHPGLHLTAEVPMCRVDLLGAHPLIMHQGVEEIAPGMKGRGILIEGLPRLVDGFRRVTQRAMEGRQVDAGRHQTGRQRQCAPLAGYRLMQMAERTMDIAEALLGDGHGRLQAQRFLQRGLGILAVAAAMQGVAKGEPGVGELRRQRHGPLGIAQRVRQFSAGQRTLRGIRPDRGSPRSQLQAAAEGPGGFRMASRLHAHHPQRIPQRRIATIQPDGGIETFQRTPAIATETQRQTQHMPGPDVLRTGAGQCLRPKRRINVPPGIKIRLPTRQIGRRHAKPASR